MYMVNPTLNTIRMVEKIIKDSNETIVKISEIKKNLPRKINHNVLMEVLEYLEENNRIYVSVKGITYLVNNSKKLRDAIQKGYRFPEDFDEK